MNVTSLISATVTPVALISACGLVILALYNRLSAILARIRAFHQQKIDLLKNFDDSENIKHTETLLKLIDSQIEKVTFKAKTIQKGLYCLLSAVLAFLVCAILSSVAFLHDSMGVAALGTQALGVALFIAGLAWAIRELTLSLSPLEEESAYLEILTAQHRSRNNGTQMIRVAKGA